MRIFRRNVWPVVGFGMLLSVLIVVLAASIGAAREATIVTTGTGRCLHIVIRVADYEKYQEILNPGDLLWIRAARTAKRGTGEVLFSEERYEQVKSRLIELQNVPVRKCIIFSSYEDLEDKIDDIAPYVDMVAYNSEPHITPDEELAQIEDSVKRFAQLARSRDLAVGWGPTIMRLNEQPELLELASEVDLIGLQHQNILAHLGVEETVSQTKQRSLIIREFNPNIEINLQLKGDLKAIEDVLRQTADYVDTVFILTLPSVSFDYQQLFNDVDLRSGCTGQGLPGAQTATEVAPTASATVASPTPEPSGETPIPCIGGIGFGLLLTLLVAFWHYSIGTEYRV